MLERKYIQTELYDDEIDNSSLQPELFLFKNMFDEKVTDKMKEGRKWLLIPNIIRVFTFSGLTNQCHPRTFLYSCARNIKTWQRLTSKAKFQIALVKTISVNNVLIHCVFVLSSQSKFSDLFLLPFYAFLSRDNPRRID